MSDTPITDAAEEEVLKRYLHYKPDPTKRDLVRAMDEAGTAWKLCRKLERQLACPPAPAARLAATVNVRTQEAVEALAV